MIIWLYQKKQNKNKRNLQIVNLNHEKAILAAQLEVQENTFKKISQEIHDNISLTLALSKLHLNTLETVDHETKSVVENSVDLISKALSDLNDISKSMDSELIKTHGLIHALESELAIFSRSGKFEIDFKVTGEFVFMDPDKELIIYRIVQEACNNILKHSYANCISLTLAYQINELNLIIGDNGIGFKDKRQNDGSRKKPGMGLNNIRNRAKMLNAKFDIQSIPNTGTILTLHIPLEEQISINGTKNQSRLS